MESISKSTATELENPPPRIWQIPVEIRRRLSGKVGRQRAIAFESHLVLVLHPVPDASGRRNGVYFWRNPAGEWSYSEQGAGYAALETLVQGYENSVIQLEQQNEIAGSTKEWFALLDVLGPLHRASRNLHEALLQGMAESHRDAQQSQLQKVCDQASEIERSAELLQLDVQNSIQYSMARQAELQARFSHSQSMASHRLNILVATFLPLATLSSVFGMNLHSGMESAPAITFWLLLAVGAIAGIGISIFVMQVKGINPDEW